MLVQFSFSNFKSFKDEAVLDLVVSNNKRTNLYASPVNQKSAALKATVLFGANASGKTKLFEAFGFMKTFVCPPKRDNIVPTLDYWQTKYDTFRLNTESRDQSSYFEVVFIIDGIQYRYGFELDRRQIIAEWLYIKRQRENNVFTRDANGIKYNKEHINQKIANNIIQADMVSPTASLLAVLRTFNEQTAIRITHWFESVMVVSANDIRSSVGALGTTLLDDAKRKNDIVKFLKAFDVNIEGMNLHEMHVEDIPAKIKAMVGEQQLKGSLYDGIGTLHHTYNSLYERVEDTWFSLEKDESYGTNRLFWLSWAIISSLKAGTPLLIDEFDSGIHPHVTQAIIELYYHSQTNAQLVINTQNAAMLHYKNEQGEKLFIKDQVFLVNKNRYGESTLTPLTDYQNDMRSNLETLYLDGDFGGVPYISTLGLQQLINEE